MIDFLLIAFILLIINLSTQYFYKNYKNKKILEISYWLQVLILMTLSICRDYSIGNDTEKYVLFYEENNYQYSRFEPGFIWFMERLHSINSNPRFLILITSVIIFYSYGLTIKRYSKNPSLSLYIIFCYSFFNFALSGIRESLAIAIILLSLPYLLKQETIKFILFIGLASLFHITAIIFIFAPLIIRINLNYKTFIACIILSFGLLLLFSKILAYALILVPAYNSYIGGKYFGETRLASILDLLILIGIFVFCFNIFKDKQKSYNRIFLKLVLSSIIIMFASLEFNLLSRLALYYSFYICIIIPNALSELNAKLRKYYKTNIALIFTIYNCIILIYRPEWNSTFPYKFYFS